MTDEPQRRDRTPRGLVAELVAAYVAKNHVAAYDLPGLIIIVGEAFNALKTGSIYSSKGGSALPTQTQIAASITDNGLISFIDGKPYKVLRQHLKLHGLDAQGYRDRFRLPSDYPTVAPSYSERRTAIALQLKFGRYKRT